MEKKEEKKKGKNRTVAELLISCNLRGILSYMGRESRKGLTITRKTSTNIVVTICHAFDRYF